MYKKMDIQNTTPDGDSDNDSLMGALEEDDLAAEIDEAETSNQSTLMLLIKQLRLNIVELKVAQKLQNTNLLLHIDQLKKKYTSLKVEVDSLKAEKRVTKTDSCQQTEECLIKTPETRPDEQVNGENINSVDNNNESICTSLVNDGTNHGVHSEKPLPVERNEITSSARILEISSSENNSGTMVNSGNSGTSLFNENPHIPGLPKILSVVGRTNIIRNTAVLKRNLNNGQATESIPVVTKRPNIVAIEKKSDNTKKANLEEILHKMSENFRIPPKEKLTNNETIVENNTGLINDNIYSAILGYIENITGREINIVSYSSMNQNDWVMVNRVGSQYHTIIICITMFDGGIFNVSTVKQMGRGDPTKEKYYNIVYEFKQQDVTEKSPSNNNNKTPEKTTTAQIEKSSESAPSSHHKTQEVTPASNSSLKESTYQQNVGSLPLRMPQLTTIPKSSVHIPITSRNKPTSIVPNQQPPQRDILQRDHTFPSPISPNRSEIQNPISQERVRILENTSSQHLKQVINNKFQILKNAASNPPNFLMFNQVNSNAGSRNVTIHRQPQSPMTNQTVLTNNKPTYATPRPLVTVSNSLNHCRIHPSNTIQNAVNNDKSRTMISVEDRRQKKRNRNFKTKKNYKNKNNFVHNSNELNSVRVIESLIRNSCEVQSQRKGVENVFVRTEKKQLSNLPSVILREHVPMEAEEEEEEQILPVNQDDDVTIVEIEEKPIEID